MLPKEQYPIHTFSVPSLKKSFKFRPFLVKEEKILLIAKDTDNPADFLTAIKQVVNNCALDKKFDVDKLATFDIEYLFLKLRAISVDNISKVSYIDNEDGQKYDFEIDLNKVEVEFPDKINKTIKLTDNTAIEMRYPPATLYDDEEFLKINKDFMFELIIRCLDKIYVDDTVYDLSKYKKEEIEEFLDNLSVKAFTKINDFLMKTPRLYHVVEYKNSLGNDRKIEFTSLSDFFT